MAVILLCAAPFTDTIAAADTPASGVWNFQIATGQTLIGISEQFLEEPNDWPKLQKFNKIANPRRLQPGSVLRIPVELLKRTATVAEVVFVRGRATLVAEKGEANQATRSLQIGDSVRSHDVIRTDHDATLSLRFADGSRLLISPGSQVSVVHLLEIGRAGIPDVQLEILQGSTEIHVMPRAGKRFEIRTPAMNLGVRGTDFRARVDSGGKLAMVEVLSGRVGAVAQGAEVGVNAGLGTFAEVGKPVQPPQQLMNPPDLSGVTRRIERLPLRFAWPELADAKGYRAQVLAPNDAEQILLDSRFTQAWARWADLPDGSYRLRVRAINAQGLEGLDAVQQFVIKARPEAPFTSSPAPRASSYGESTVFTWAAADAARRYRLQVARDAKFTAMVFDDASIEGTSRELKLAPGEYHWRIASIAVTADGQDDIGPFSEGQPFTQREIPPSPKTEAPQVSPDGVRLRWSAPEPGQQIRFQIASDRAFETIVLDQTTKEDTGMLGKPAPGMYFIRTKTIDADGFEGNFGAIQQFEVPKPPPPAWLLLIPLGLLLVL